MAEPPRDREITPAPPRADEDRRQEATTQATTQATEPRDGLLAAVEAELLPRLLLLQEDDAPRLAAPAASWALSREEIAALARIAALPDLAGARAFVATLRQRGHGDESLLRQLIAPAARLLAEQRREALCSSGEACVGLGTLQRIVRALQRDDPHAAS